MPVSEALCGTPLVFPQRLELKNLVDLSGSVSTYSALA